MGQGVFGLGPPFHCGFCRLVRLRLRGSLTFFVYHLYTLGRFLVVPFSFLYIDIYSSKKYLPICSIVIFFLTQLVISFNWCACCLAAKCSSFFQRVYHILMLRDKYTFFGACYFYSQEMLQFPSSLILNSVARHFQSECLLALSFLVTMIP